jgi:hypothetical protein
LQNTATNLGASLGTGLAGSVLIAILTSSFLVGLEANPAVSDEIANRASVELAGGVPFFSDVDLETALEGAGLTDDAVAAAVDANRTARITGLDAALALLAVIAVIALFAAQRIPTMQPGTVTPAQGSAG